MGEAEGPLHLELIVLDLTHLEQADVVVQIASSSVHGMDVYLEVEPVPPPHLLHSPPDAGGLGVVRPVVVAEEDLQLPRASPGQVLRPTYPEQQCAAVMMYRSETSAAPHMGLRVARTPNPTIQGYSDT